MVAAVAVPILLARGHASADICSAYDYCAEWTFRCVLNNAIVSTSVGVSMGATRLQCMVTDALVGTRGHGICHTMGGSIPEALDQCMADNIGATLLVVLLACVVVDVTRALVDHFFACILFVAVSTIFVLSTLYRKAAAKFTKE